MSKLAKVTSPEWFMFLKDSALVSANDLYPMLGYANRSSLIDLMDTGILPYPHCVKKGYGKFKTPLRYWTAGQIRATIIVLNNQREDN